MNEVNYRFYCRLYPSHTDYFTKGVHKSTERGSSDLYLCDWRLIENSRIFHPYNDCQYGTKSGRWQSPPHPTTPPHTHTHSFWLERNSGLSHVHIAERFLGDCAAPTRCLSARVPYSGPLGKIYSKAPKAGSSHIYLFLIPWQNAWNAKHCTPELITQPPPRSFFYCTTLFKAYEQYFERCYVPR